MYTYGIERNQRVPDTYRTIKSSSIVVTLSITLLTAFVNGIIQYLYFMTVIIDGEISLIFFELVGTSVIYSFPQLILLCIGHTNESLLYYNKVAIGIISIGMIIITIGIIGGSLFATYTYPIVYFIVSGIVILSIMIAQLILRKRDIKKLNRLIERGREMQQVNVVENRNINRTNTNATTTTKTNTNKVDEGNADVMPQYTEDDSLL